SIDVSDAIPEHVPVDVLTPSRPVEGRGIPVPMTTDSSQGWPVFVGLLGGFILLKAGTAIDVRPGGKVESFLSVLALRNDLGAPRDEVLTAVWPDADPALAAHSLNALVSSLHRQFGDVLGGDGLVVRAAGRYRLNVGPRVGLDIEVFEAAAERGDAARRAGDVETAKAAYQRAAGFYRGDLCIGSDVRHVLDRERLLVRYLAIQAALADSLFAEGDYEGALARSLDLLGHDPCREDAHRLVIRCYMRIGERAQALRQYQLCRGILRSEFEAEPEPATTALYHQVRLHPDAI
ncbi:MAG TPA: BTAD domain-containing putative transcriptional regulator, partial [Actinomycetota bacterium]|nr:BTAD domain-containing putative transcriptional regulator [Actinomycetota bacterium]